MRGRNWLKSRSITEAGSHAASPLGLGSIRHTNESVRRVADEIDALTRSHRAAHLLIRRQCLAAGREIFARLTRARVTQRSADASVELRRALAGEAIDGGRGARGAGIGLRAGRGARRIAIARGHALLVVSADAGRRTASVELILARGFCARRQVRTLIGHARRVC